MGDGFTEHSHIMPNKAAADSVIASDIDGTKPDAPKRTGSMPFAVANLANTILGSWHT
jgi:hypothetical protein